MTILSFSVCLDEIKEGIKTRSMRPVVYDGHENWKWKKVFDQFWNPAFQDFKDAGDGTQYVKQGHPCLILQIYWKARSKAGFKLFDAVLTNITKAKLGDLSEDQWKLDGFKPTGDWTARMMGLKWFHETYRLPMDLGDINLSQQLLNFGVYIIEFKRMGY